MSLKDIFKNAGLVSDDEPATDDTAETKQPVARRNTLDGSALGSSRPTPLGGVSLPPTNFAPMGSAAFGAVVAPDAEIVQGLTQATAKAQSRGYDKFRTNLTTLEGMSDVQRYPMALKLTQANFNISPDAIVASLDDCVKAVDAEKANYESAFNDQVKKEITDVQAAIQQRVEQITKLNQEVQDLNGKAQASQQRLTQEKATFDASYDVVKNGFVAERQKVASLFTPTAK